MPDAACGFGRRQIRPGLIAMMMYSPIFLRGVQWIRVRWSGRMPTPFSVPMGAVVGDRKAPAPAAEEAAV